MKTAAAAVGRGGAWDRRHVLVAAVWLVVVLRIASEFSGRGSSYWHVDLRTLFREQSSFYRGVYPAADVAAGEAGAGAVHSDYPPYSFVLMVACLPPGLSWRGTELWFATCQLAALAVLVGFAWRRGRAVGSGAAWLLAGSVLAMTGLRADLLFGNLGTIMAAMLVLLLGALERGRWTQVGAAWVASVLKPQMGWLFALCFFSRRRWRTLAVAALTLLALGGVAFWWTGVTPLTMLQSKYSNRVTTMALLPERHNLISLLGGWGVPASVGVVSGAIAGMAWVWVALRGRLKAADGLGQFAFVGLVNRICTYHNACDDLLMIFALVWLGRSAWRGDTRGAWAVFLLLGATVWAPSFALLWTGANALIVASWVAVAAWLWRKGRPDEVKA